MSDSSLQWSQPVEHWLDQFHEPTHTSLACDILIIGSGYGGSFAARELAQPGTTVWVMERGREYALGDFPEDLGMLPAHVRMQSSTQAEPKGFSDGLLDLRTFEQLSVLLGNGLGGGSLINAGVALRPDPALLEQASWPAHYRNSPEGRAELWQAMADVEQQLQASPLADAEQLDKFKALVALGQSMGIRAEPAPLTIASVDQTSSAGVIQKACTRCGNCFTGCNVGAKNTMATHVIPDAVRQGAQFITGATALEVMPLGGDAKPAAGAIHTARPPRWAVRMVVTQSQGNGATRHEFVVHAHTVILSAGALGSTEILLKSPQVSTSPMLGRRFSTNGDVLAMGWGMKGRVNGMALTEANTQVLQAPEDRVGPTITGILRAKVTQADGSQRTVLIEEGAVPSALTAITTAMAATLSLPHRYTGSEGPAYFAPGYGVDRLATPPNMSRHAMLLLGMGPDDADGVMALKTHKNGSTGLDIRWSAKGTGPASPYYQGVHQWLAGASEKSDGGGFQGGDYLTNPLWQTLPEDFNEITGDSQTQQGVTVHPLGGCPMGDDTENGAVDWRGTVFRADGGLNEGLHVLDGAMLPSAVGVNPFLTISALSVTAARSIRAHWPARAEGDWGKAPEPQPQAHAEAPPKLASQAMTLQFREHLQGRWKGEHPHWLPLPSPHLTPNEQERAWVVAVDVSLDLEQWLANPSMRLEGARLQIFRNTHPQDITVHPDACKGTPVMEGTGWVSLLALDAPTGRWDQFQRIACAVLAFLQRRGIRELFSLTTTGRPRTGEGGLQALLRRAKGFIRAARNLSYYRQLIYEFELQPSDQPHFKVQAQGHKRLAYAPGNKNIWDALVQIDMTLSPHNGANPAQLSLTADLIDMVRNHRLQVSRAANTPVGIAGLAAFGALWLRAIFQTHFWSFRGLEYAHLKPPAVAQHGPLAGAQMPVRVPLSVPRHRDTALGPEQLALELTCYEPLKPSAPPRHLLMIHGLAHGGTVFTTDTTDGRNMAAAFVADGYTVWVLDHRLSNRLPYCKNDHCMDDVAELDIPAAVRHVYQVAGQPIAVFAHCVGGGAFAMATLKGWLQAPDTGVSMVGKAIIHAVHPWVVPSASNQLSGSVAALYKDFLPKEMSVNPVPPAGSGAALDQVLDRMAASLPWPANEIDLHQKHQLDPLGGTATCNRMTLLYGREWVHANLADATHRELASLVGPASVEVFRQLFFIINRQRLTDRDGASVYMTAAQFQAHWTFPILFAHGSENRVFDPRSAVRSWSRFRQLQGSPVARVFMADGYGHMDFLFGKNAHRDVYPHLTAFLRNPAAFQSTWGADVDTRQIPHHWVDHDARAKSQAVVGPHIRLQDASINHGTGRQLGLWVEFPNDPTRQAPSPTLHNTVGQPLPQWHASRLEHVHLYPEGDRDVTLLQGPGAYWTGLWTEPADGAFRAVGDLHIRWGKDGELGHAALAFSRFTWWRRWIGEPVAEPVSWLALSCRWPGTPFESQAVDAVAQHMLAHVSDAQRPVDALVMLGDQIYADAMANLLQTRETDELLAGLYRDAWGSPHTQELLRSLPSYTVVDDHEFGDNWCGALDPSTDTDFVNGFEAAFAYQWRQAADPAPHCHAKPNIQGQEITGFWNAFHVGGIPFFAADTRSERQLRTQENWHSQTMVGSAQMAALKAWLLEYKNRPKVLCSGSVFGFVERCLQGSTNSCVNADGWSGYPATWRDLVQFIVEEQIQHLIFLSGDYHFSGMAELELQGSDEQAPVRALSVVCSGWNASLPFINSAPPDFALHAWADYPLSDARVRARCRAIPLSTALRQFSKLTLAQSPQGAWELTARVYDAGGQKQAQQSFAL